MSSANARPAWLLACLLIPLFPGCSEQSDATDEPEAVLGDFRRCAYSVSTADLCRGNSLNVSWSAQPPPDALEVYRGRDDGHRLSIWFSPLERRHYLEYGTLPDYRDDLPPDYAGAVVLTSNAGTVLVTWSEAPPAAFIPLPVGIGPETDAWVLVTAPLVRFEAADAALTGHEIVWTFHEESLWAVHKVSTDQGDFWFARLHPRDSKKTFHEEGSDFSFTVFMPPVFEQEFRDFGLPLPP